MGSTRFPWSHVVLNCCATLFALLVMTPAMAERFLAGHVLDLTRQSGGEIPFGQTAITSLTLGADGKVYGATSADRPGKEAYLFRSDGTDVEILGKLSPALPGQQKVWHSLLAGSDGNLYGGTWTDAQPGQAQPSGHLFQYDVAAKEVIDLGIVAPGEGVYVMTANDQQDLLYGVTTPGCLLFAYDIAQRKLRVIGDIMASIKAYLEPPIEEDVEDAVTDVGELKGKGWEPSLGGEPWQKRYFPPRAIVCDDRGNVWGSRDQGFFFKYDVKRDQLLDTDVQMPLMVGTEDTIITEISVDALAIDKQGLIYGGTYSDGYVFKFNPATGEVICLGKPIRQQRIRALACSPDGMLYGVGGEDDFISKLFRYDPSSGDLREPGIVHDRGWTIYRIDTMIVDPQGTIYLGENSRISHLVKLDEIKEMPMLAP